MALVALFPGVLVLRGVVFARSFPQVHDAAIMRYVVFMIDRGHAPYTWMVEMNPPGTLMTEWFSRHVFGDGAAGLWRWDTCIGLVAVAVAAWIAGRGYRAAGMCGAMLAWLLHQAGGARDFAQRDWFLAVLLLLASGCAAEAMRKSRPAWMAPALCCAAWGSAIKPYAALLALAMVALACLKARRQQRTLHVLAWSALGGALPVVAVVLFFRHWSGSFPAFLHTARTLGAWYTHLDQAPLLSMFTQVMPMAMFLVLALTLYLWGREKIWRYPGDLLLGTGFLVCMAMYLLQRKGFTYQTYPLAMFGFVGAFVVAQRSLHLGRDQRLVAIAVWMAALFGLPLGFSRQQRSQLYPAGAQKALIRDLQRLGGDQLSGHVQCLDMTMGGCIGALAALHLEQPTGFVNDHMLFPHQPEPFLAEIQQRFLNEVASAKPQLIVLSSHNWPDERDRTFSKLDRWPEFRGFLSQHYRLQKTWQPGTSEHSAGYRIYVRQ